MFQVLLAHGPQGPLDGVLGEYDEKLEAMAARDEANAGLGSDSWPRAVVGEKPSDAHPNCGTPIHPQWIQPFRRLVSELNAGSAVADDKERNKVGRQKKHPLLKRLEKLGPEAMALAVKCMVEGWAVVSVPGYKFMALKNSDGSFSVRGFEADAEEHTVRDGACSCADCRIRGNKCKHLQALAKLSP